MNRIDQQLFSVMVTVEIHFHLSQREPFRHVAQLGKYISDMMVRFKKQGTIDKRVFRYYRESLAPQSNGFHERWKARLSRYMEIAEMERKLGDLTDLERLHKALEAIKVNMRIVTATGIGDEISFEGDEQERAGRYGFLGLAASEEAEAFVDGNIPRGCWLSARLPSQEAIVSVFKYLQTFGFSIHQHETTVQPKKVGFICLLSPSTQNEAQRRAA